MSNGTPRPLPEVLDFYDRYAEESRLPRVTESLPRCRLDGFARAWGVTVERIADTPSSTLAFGVREGQPVVLKIARAAGDEWRSGRVLASYGGRGTVRVLEQEPGAVLVERALPGRSLADVTLAGDDDLATRVLADTIRQMTSEPVLSGVPTVADWGRAFDRYLAGGDTQVPPPIVHAAHDVYRELCATQRRVQLLHGDLHHANVVFDRERGWLAIDPKGVLGELEYELGAALRNPVDRPELYAPVACVRRRLACLAATLRIDTERAMRWTFAQAVLAVIWLVEDGDAVSSGVGWLQLAANLHPLVAYDSRRSVTFPKREDHL